MQVLMFLALLSSFEDVHVHEFGETKYICFSEEEANQLLNIRSEFRKCWLEAQKTKNQSQRNWGWLIAIASLIILLL